MQSSFSVGFAEVPFYFPCMTKTIPSEFYQTNLKALQAEGEDVELSSVTYQVAQDFFDAQKETADEQDIKGFTSVIIISQDGKVVLAHKGYGLGGWSLPGGAVENDESFSEGAAREVLEEIGVRLEQLTLLLIEEEIFVSPKGEQTHSLLGVFGGLMRKFALPPLTEGAIEEGLTLELFDPENLPENITLTDREKIEAYFERDIEK